MACGDYHLHELTLAVRHIHLGIHYKLRGRDTGHVWHAPLARPWHGTRVPWSDAYGPVCVYPESSAGARLVTRPLTLGFRGYGYELLQFNGSHVRVGASECMAARAPTMSRASLRVARGGGASARGSLA
jgi:hypothetical protein